METPSIYVACLASYNSGILHGAWIDATQSEDEIMDEIKEMLSDSPESNAEEYAIHAFQGFNGIELEEYDSIETVVNYVAFIEKHGKLGVQLLRDYSIEEVETMLEEQYQGCYDSEVDFARQLFDDCYAHQVPKSLAYYFDYNAFASDLFINDFFSVEFGGKTHVFSIY